MDKEKWTTSIVKNAKETREFVESLPEHIQEQLIDPLIRSITDKANMGAYGMATIIKIQGRELVALHTPIDEETGQIAVFWLDAALCKELNIELQKEIRRHR